MIAAIAQSSAILVLALAAARTLRKQSAAVRHFVLSAGMAGSIVVLLFSAALPEIRLSGARKIQSFIEDSGPMFGMLGAPGLDRIPAPPSALTVSSPLRSRTILWIWFSGSMLAWIVLGIGAWRLARLGRRSKVLADVRCHAAFRETARAIGLSRPVRLLQSDEFVLGTWGILLPRVFLPADVCRWSDERLRLVLTHELAHIRRFDWAVQMMAECARAVYWFNPLFWLACRRLRSESEHACDDVVLNAGFDAKEYAAQLLALARTSKNSDRGWSPVLAMSRLPLERRFIAMLNPSINRHALSRSAATLIWTATFCVTLTLAATFRISATERPAAAEITPPAAIAGPEAPVVPAVVPPAPAPKPVTTRVIARPMPQGRADGSLTGSVFDPSGAAVPGVTVTILVLENGENGIRENPIATAVADEAGRFAFNALVPGQYSLKAELPGFATFRRSGIEILPSLTRRENLYLSLGNIASRVEILVAGQPRPPAPPAMPQRIRIGGNVVAANLISQVKPVYPQSARDAGIEGTVHLQGIIGIDGTFLTLRVVRSNDADLANAALESARQWRYKPTLLNGQPIEVQTEIEMEFRIVQ